MKKEETEPDQPFKGHLLKAADETARRVLAILCVVGRVHDPERSADWMRKHALESFLSPAEAAFIRKKRPTEDERAEFSWRAEAAVSLLWALGAMTEMPPLNEQYEIFSLEMVRAAMTDPVAFIGRAVLRGEEEIRDKEQWFYHQHWRVRDAQLVGMAKLLPPNPDDPPIEELDPGIVYERRYALSWLVGWGDDWDKVPTDT